MTTKVKSPAATKFLVQMIQDYIDSENISRAELARRLDVNKSFVSKVLNSSKPCTVDTLLSMADKLGLDVRFYVKGIDKKK